MQATEKRTNPITVKLELAVFPSVFFPGTLVRKIIQFESKLHVLRARTLFSTFGARDTQKSDPSWIFVDFSLLPPTVAL